ESVLCANIYSSPTPECFQERYEQLILFRADGTMLPLGAQIMVHSYLNGANMISIPRAIVRRGEAPSRVISRNTAEPDLRASLRRQKWHAKAIEHSILHSRRR